MTLDLAILLAQTSMLFFLAGWLTTGALENLFKPKLNSTYTAEVLDMTRLREDFPEAYTEVSGRRIANPALQLFLFRLIVAWELLALIILWIGVVQMVLALFGTTDTETARAWAVLGAMFFTSVWAGFLVAGNWFCYWFGHEGAQNTHFQMTLWGMSVLIFLTIS